MMTARPEPIYSARDQGFREALLQVRSFIAKHGKGEVDAFCAQALHDLRMDTLHWNAAEAAPVTKVTCPVCKSLVERGAVLGEFQPVELDEHGLPWACAGREGFGLPIWDAFGLKITLNGELVKHPIAFDRRAGVVWTLQCNGKGQPITPIQTDGIQHVNRHEGEVAVDWQERT